MRLGENYLYTDLDNLGGATDGAFRTRTDQIQVKMLVKTGATYNRMLSEVLKRGIMLLSGR